MRLKMVEDETSKDRRGEMNLVTASLLGNYVRRSCSKFFVAVDAYAAANTNHHHPHTHEPLRFSFSLSLSLTLSLTHTLTHSLFHKQ